MCEDIIPEWFLKDEHTEKAARSLIWTMKHTNDEDHYEKTILFCKTVPEEEKEFLWTENFDFVREILHETTEMEEFDPETHEGLDVLETLLQMCVIRKAVLNVAANWENILSRF